MEYSYPIQRAVKKNKNNKLEMFDSKYFSSRSQDLEKSYHDAGQFYWMNTQNVLKKKSLFTNNSGALIITEMEGQDIDNLSDWKLAEMKYKLL
jgi:N-acylneuraminate cytidylyltransferase